MPANDSDLFSDEIVLTIHNLNNTQVKIFKGQAVAQVMFTRVLVPTFTVTNLALPGAADSVVATTTFGAIGEATTPNRPTEEGEKLQGIVQDDLNRPLLKKKGTSKQ